ncbi:hypothetical protein EOD39_14465 [Acipenser ruthenus]|uniref:Uncharacterized protein n=1 Tax=Acipenser ruthenus TaxID=7906 RepID=A0A662YN36_ACIRT|nr:hypothetical protein EOD39_14465 [Acipenser ruthenus]
MGSWGAAMSPAVSKQTTAGPRWYGTTPRMGNDPQPPSLLSGEGCVSGTPHIDDSMPYLPGQMRHGPAPNMLRSPRVDRWQATWPDRSRIGETQTSSSTEVRASSTERRAPRVEHLKCVRRAPPRRAPRCVRRAPKCVRRALSTEVRALSVDVLSTEASSTEASSAEGACVEHRIVKHRASGTEASRVRVSSTEHRAPSPMCRSTKHQAQKRCTKRRSAAPSAEVLTPKAPERERRSASTERGTLAQTPKHQLTRRAETLSAGTVSDAVQYLPDGAWDFARWWLSSSV